MPDDEKDFLRVGELLGDFCEAAAVSPSERPDEHATARPRRTRLGGAGRRLAGGQNAGRPGAGLGLCLA